MACKRRASQAVADAQERATNLKAIEPALDSGGGLTVAAVQTALEMYNKQLGILFGRMRAGIGVRFGKDSSEQEMAGGCGPNQGRRKQRTDMACFETSCQM